MRTKDSTVQTVNGNEGDAIFRGFRAGKRQLSSAMNRMRGKQMAAGWLGCSEGLPSEHCCCGDS